MQKRKFCHIELLSGSLLFILLQPLFAPSVAGHLVFITSASMVFYTKCDASVAIFTMVIWYVTIVHAWNPRVDRWWGWRVSSRLRKEMEGISLLPTDVTKRSSLWSPWRRSRGLSSRRSWSISTSCSIRNSCQGSLVLSCSSLCLPSRTLASPSLTRCWLQHCRRGWQRWCWNCSGWSGRGWWWRSICQLDLKLSVDFASLCEQGQFGRPTNLLDSVEHLHRSGQFISQFQFRHLKLWNWGELTLSTSFRFPIQFIQSMRHADIFYPQKVESGKAITFRTARFRKNFPDKARELRYWRIHDTCV